MTTTGYEVLGAGIITFAALIGKVIENSSHFHAARQKPAGKGSTVTLYYECCNFHLHLSLGMLGLAWSQHWDASLCCPLIIMIMLGVTTKGVIASSTPGTLSFSDFDAFLGLWLPNGLALVCVAWALVGKQILPHQDEGGPPHAKESSTISAPARTTPNPKH